MNAIARCALVISLFSVTAVYGFMLGDPANGARIHESKCADCHIQRFGGDGSQIYLREDRRIKTVEGLMAQVQFCDRQIQSNLSEDQINDVTIYLNEKYYKFE